MATGDWWDQFGDIMNTTAPPNGFQTLASGFATGSPDQNLPENMGATDQGAYGGVYGGGPVPVDPGMGRITDNPWGSSPIPVNPYASGPLYRGEAAQGGPVMMADFDAAWQSSPYPGTVDGLKQFFAAHPEYAAAGITLGGSKGDKVYGPGGAYWGDAVIAAGLGGQGKSRLSGDQGGGAGAGGLASGYMTAPFTGQYKLPSLDELKAMPGYNAGLDAARTGVERSAAARGTLLTGGTLKGINQAEQDYAQQSYGNLAGLQMGQFGINRDIFYHNQDSPFSKYLNLAQLGKPS